MPEALRAEVESLLRFDAAGSDSLGGYVAAAAQSLASGYALRPGARLGPYEMLSLAGAGGMGEVYKARDIRLARTVAIKILPPHIAGDAGLNQRFAREARMLAALSHPHICSVFDVGHHDSTAFLVMEYLHGETLAQRLVKGPLPLGEGLRYAIQIADALDKAHSAGIVHRDLKPGNIMLTSSGVKLLDFGLAKLAATGLGKAGVPLRTTASMTERGTIVGTFQCMAPEQLEGGEVDARTDIFASEQFHAWPSFLPDGRHFLYSAADRNKGGVFAASLDSKDSRSLLQIQSNAFYASGYLLFGNNGALMAQPFDPARLRLEGDPVQIADHVFFNPANWRSAFEVSKAGILAYRGGAPFTLSQFRWFDRTGQSTPVDEVGEHFGVNLSRDGRTIATDRRDQQTGNRDIWLMDVSRGTTSRLTTHPAPESYPVWSADGDRIVFASARDDPSETFDSLYLKMSNGSPVEEPILKLDAPQVHQHPLDWSRDGRYVLFERSQAADRATCGSCRWLQKIDGRSSSCTANSMSSPRSFSRRPLRRLRVQRDETP